MASVKPNELISSDWIGEKTDTIQWNSYTLGQNKKIAEIAAAAQKAGVLLNANMEFARTSITAAGLLLKAAVSPQIILLNAVADEIDNFMSDFKNIEEGQSQLVMTSNLKTRQSQHQRQLQRQQQ